MLRLIVVSLFLAAGLAAGLSLSRSATATLTPSLPTVTVETTPTLPVTSTSTTSTTVVTTELSSTSAATTTSSTVTRPTPPSGTVLLQPRTRAGGCVLRAVPDRRCSPGAYDAGMTSAVLCSAGSSAARDRSVPASERRAVEAAYGLPPRRYGRALEIDAVVSLNLGGSTDVANLFPERAPGYLLKNRLERRLHTLVCSGAMTLRAAQVGIARDWRQLYAAVFGDRR